MGKQKKEKTFTVSFEINEPMPKSFYDRDEFAKYMAENLEYAECGQCSSFVQEVSQCNVCNDSFCIDCRDEHASEEVGY